MSRTLLWQAPSPVWVNTHPAECQWPPHWPHRDVQPDGKASSVPWEPYRSHWQEQPVHPLLGTCHCAPNPSLQKTGLACSPQCCNPGNSASISSSAIKQRGKILKKWRNVRETLVSSFTCIKLNVFLKIYALLYFTCNVFKVCLNSDFLWSKLCRLFGGYLLWRHHYAVSN